MDFTTNLQCLSLGPTSSKSSFVYSSVSTVKSATSTTNAYALLTDILHKLKVVICSTRRDFIRWCANSFTALTQGQLRGVGHCAIVVGERGTGKSFLFQKIASATVELVPNTIVCYVLYKAVKPMTPLEVLVSLMATTYHADWSAIKSVSNLYAHLEDKGHFIIFFIDELDAVFAGDGELYSNIINQLLAISEMSCDTRRILVVATGSSVCLRRLCFATASAADRMRYPTYSGRSFNDRKYTFLTVGSLQDVKELLNAKRILRPSWDDDITNNECGDDQDDEEHCMDELSLTRGVMQCVVDLDNGQLYTERRQTVTFMEKRNDLSLQKLWRALLTVLRKNSPGRMNAVLCDARLWTNLPTAAFAEMQAVDPSITLSDLYIWVDTGFISLADVHADTNNAYHHVTFAHGTDFMWAVTKLSAPNDGRISFGRPLQSVLSVDEQSCLLNPSGTDLHEQLFAEALASNYAMDFPNCDAQLKFDYMFGTWKAAAFEESCCDGVLRKISPDIGVDLVAMHDVTIKGVPTLILSLFQCKMTQNCKSYLAHKKSPKQANVPDIVAGFERTTGDIQLRILTTGALAGRQLRIQKFLVTPLRVSDQTKIKLNEFEIQLIGCADLSKLWPSRVLNFIRNGGEKTEKLAFLLPEHSRNENLNNAGKHDSN